MDQLLGAAWMVIAAEQGSRRYALARDQMVTLLTHAEFAETDRLFGQLQPKYGGAGGDAAGQGVVGLGVVNK